MHPLFVCKFCTPVALSLLLLKIRTLVRTLGFSRDSCSIPVANAAPRKIQGKSKEIKA